MNGLTQTNTAGTTSETEDNVTVNVSKNSNTKSIVLTLFDRLNNEIGPIELVNGRASLNLPPVDEDRVYRIKIHIKGTGSSAILTVNVKSNIEKKIFKTNIKVSDGLGSDQEIKRPLFIIEGLLVASQTGAA